MEFKGSIAEAYLTQNIMPVNCIVACNELIEIMRDTETNSFKNMDHFTPEQQKHIYALMNFLNAHIYGEFAKIDVSQEFLQLMHKVEEKPLEL